LQVWDPSGPRSFFAKLPGFPDARGGLVSTADDYLAFAQMMMNQGKSGKRQVLSAKSVEAMMTDQVPAEVQARSMFIPGFWEERGWGYAGSIVKKHVPGGPRGYGWDGGYGTEAYWDKKTGVIAIMLSQRLVESPVYPPIFQKFFDGAYSAAGI
jgi:CubicO group peptidase (beta-lactamase class C family)